MVRMISRSGNRYTSRNKVKLIHGGKEYFTLLLQLIENATDTIHLQTYIFREDTTGLLVAEALMAAAKRKVNVYLLTDGYASQSLSDELQMRMRKSGIRFRFFEPFFRSKYFYFGRRMHHKVLVTDTRYALVGGINIADHYNDLPGKRAWFDFALFMEGEIAMELCVLCWKTWRSFPLKLGITPCERKPMTFDFSQRESIPLRMRRNDWVRRKNQISSTYIEMFRLAKSHITIVSSYFLPGETIRRILGKAAARGVTIKVITAGNSDVKLAKHAERWLYDWLLRNKVEVYEYQPSVLHAKIAVCDDEWFTIGSYNLNKLSAYASIELNIDVSNGAMAAEVQQALDLVIANECVRVTQDNYLRSKNIFTQLTRWASYELLRIIFFLITFYYRHKK